MALFFPKGLKGNCVQVPFCTELGSFTSLIPMINKILKDTKLDLDDILVCEYYKGKIKKVCGNSNIEIKPQNEIMRLTTDDIVYAIFFTENPYIVEMLLDYLENKGFGN